MAAARIKPAVVQVESHPYLPEWELLDFCRDHGIVLLAFAPLGHAMTPSVLQDPVITEIQHAITTNVRFNSVVQTGVPGFIPKVQ